MAGYYRKRLYRAREDKEIFGVCAGIAAWRDLPADPIRLAVILLAVFTGFFPVFIIYLLLAFLLPVEPEYRGARESHYHYEDKSSSYSGKKHKDGLMDDIMREFEHLKRRVGGMEDTVFDDTDDTQDKEQQWDERLHRNQ